MINPDSHVLEWLDDFLHGNLELADEEIVREHCAACKICAAGRDEAQRRFDALKAIPVSEASEQLIRATVETVQAKSARRQIVSRRASWIAIAATVAAVVIIGGFNLRYALIGPAPFDLQVNGPSRFLIGEPVSLDIGVLHPKTSQSYAGIPVEITLRQPQGGQITTLANFTTSGGSMERPQLQIPNWADGQYELTVTAKTGRGVDTVVRQVELRSPFDLHLLGQDTFLPDSTAAVRVGLFRHQSNAPYADVPIEITLTNRNSNQTITLASFKSGENPIERPRITLPDWDDALCDLRVTARQGAATQSIAQQVALRRSAKLMLSTDKPVYQPGQTIHIRALALQKPALKPLADEAAVFSIVDPNGNMIFKQREVTSKFGIAAVDCPLATEMIEGAYTIECQNGAVKSTQSVTVEHYVLPKFKVDVQLDKPFYAPAEMVTGTIESRYFFGKPVAGADVKIEVRAEAFSGEQIAALDGKTNPDGRFEFRFALPDRLTGREQDAGNARFNLTVSVTDSAGQTHAAGASRVVAADPIQLVVIPQSGALVRGVANTVYVYASYVDGRPAAARITINGGNELQTNSFGMAVYELTPADASVGLTIKAIDDMGLVGRKHVALTCGNIAGDFVIRTDKAVYDGGETMTISALGGGVEPVFIDLIKDGQVMLTETIAMEGDDESSAIDIDLPPDLFGAVRVEAYRFSSAGLAVRKTRLVVVRQAGQLKIATTFADGMDSHRPGETVRLDFQVTDQQGTPAPGAISLAAVDEAVFSVLNQGAGMETVFFLLEQELLQPVYTIYSGWRPMMNANAPDDRIAFDQALFSNTAESTGGATAMLLDRSSGNSFRPGPFSLSSFPTKDRQVQQQRRTGIVLSIIGWFSLGFVWVVIGLVFASIRIANRCGLGAGWGTAGCLLTATCLIALMFSAVQIGGCGGAGAAPTASAMADSASTGSERGPMPTSFEGQPSSDGVVPTRLREWFPETLLWQPHLVTDEQGRASLELPLADSITTWRLSASAVSSEGQLGGSVTPIKVFQPFFVDVNLPVALTRGDEVSVPVVVYNYLAEAQAVEVELSSGEWFTLLNVDAARQRVEVPPGEVRAIHFPIKVHKVGTHDLQVSASVGGFSDAVKRRIEVIADGRRVEQLVSGTLHDPVNISLEIPADAIDGSVRTIVKLHPSTFSQLVEGLESIFRMPSGCFEQTSSTTYPNVLALDYLRRTKKSAPAVEGMARQYIHVGYQRLLSFEIQGGGFDWFGQGPANMALSAYGLMEFEDMARVHDVDPNLIDRTRDWLLSQRENDGSWSAAKDALHDNWSGSARSGPSDNLGPTAFIASAVFLDGKAADRAGATLDYLLAHQPGAIESPYVLALVVNAIATIDKNNSQLKSYVDRLESLQQTNDEDQGWWLLAAGEPTTFYGSGVSGSIETTAMSAIALLNSGGNKALVRKALNWLIQQKDAHGTWHSTQATVLALKAILMGTGEALGGDSPRTIEIALGGEVVETIVISPDQIDVVRQIDLSNMVTSSGKYQLSVTEKTDTATGFQIMTRYHVPDDQPIAKSDEPLSIAIDYDRTTLRVNEAIEAVATVTNNMEQAAPMVILDLPIPGGFAIEPADLTELVRLNKIAKFQITPRQAIVYLRGLAPGDKLELRYRLRATMPVKLVVPDAQANEYYNPDIRGSGGSANLQATEA